MGSHVYLVLALGLYSPGAVHVALQALTRRQRSLSWTVTAILAGFAVHTAALSQRWTEAGHFPVVGLRDGAAFLAWAIVLAFLAVYLRTRMEALGLIAYPTAFALLLVANLTPTSSGADPMLKSVYLPVHATLAFLGYGALFVAFAAGVFYLMQERELKSRAPRRLYYLLPSLDRCDTLGARSVEVGFTFLTLAIVSGFLWNHSVYGHYWTGTPKEWSALLAWVIYVGLIVARHRTGWGGRRASLLGIAGFGVVVFTFVWMTMIDVGAPR